MANQKVFIVVRADLPPGAQLAQSCHAAFAFGIDHPDVVRQWNASSNNLVCLRADNEQALVHLANRAVQCECLVTEFHEPDFNDQATAVVIAGEQAKRVVSSLALALRLPRSAEQAGITSSSPSHPPPA